MLDALPGAETVAQYILKAAELNRREKWFGTPPAADDIGDEIAF